MSDEKIFIERCPHDQENPYAQISRNLIRDESLSMSCRWMLIYLLSHTGKWRISVTQLWNHCKKHRGGGRDSIRGYIKEACAAGYMMVDKYKENNLNRIRYYLSENPKFKKSFPRPETQEVEEQAPQGHTHKKEHPSSKEEVIKEDCADAPKSPLFIFKRVKMELSHYENLLKDIGQDKLEEMMERLDEYADINPKRFRQYANHATVIRKWMREEKSSSVPDLKRKLINNIINEVKKEWSNLIEKGEIEILNNSICFKKGTYYLELDFSDKDFVEKIKKQLAKMR